MMLYCDAVWKATWHEHMVKWLDSMMMVSSSELWWWQWWLWHTHTHTYTIGWMTSWLARHILFVAYAPAREQAIRKKKERERIFACVCPRRARGRVSELFFSTRLFFTAAHRPSTHIHTSPFLPEPRTLHTHAHHLGRRWWWGKHIHTRACDHYASSAF